MSRLSPRGNHKKRSRSANLKNDTDLSGYPSLLKPHWIVFGQKIKVVISPTEVIEEGTGRILAGNYSYLDKRITLNGTLPPEEMVRTLYHELSHALLNRVGLVQTDMTKDQHELICENFSNWIFETFG